MLELKSHVVSVIKQQPYMGEQIPLKWLKFEREVTRMTHQGVKYCSLEQVHTCKQIS